MCRPDFPATGDKIGVDVNALGRQAVDHGVTLRCWCGHTGMRDGDHPAHPPVVGAAPFVAVEGVGAGLVEGDVDNLDLPGGQVTQVDAQARADSDTMRHVVRLEAQPHALPRIDIDAVRLETARFRHPGDNIHDPHPAGGGRRFL
jgi:hypothetical protein